MFGAPRGYNASCPEKHHNAHAKRPGHCPHKNMNTIGEQCARRIADTIVMIDTMHGLFKGKQAQPVNNNVIDTGTPTFCTPYLGINCDVDKPTMEEGCGTMYCIRSFAIRKKVMVCSKKSISTRGQEHPFIWKKSVLCSSHSTMAPLTSLNKGNAVLVLQRIPQARPMSPQ